MLDGRARPRIFRPNQLEPLQNVLSAGCRPQPEQMVIHIGEGSTAADRDQTRVAVFWEDHSPNVAVGTSERLAHGQLNDAAEGARRLDYRPRSVEYRRTPRGASTPSCSRSR